MKFLINEEYLKQNTNITFQKDSKDIKVAFRTAKEHYVEDLLGIPLYELFDDAVNTTGVTLTTIQEKVLEKVKYYSALIVEFELMLNLFDITNKGNTTEDKSAAFELVKVKRNDVFNKAEKIKSDIIELLSDNKTSFPEFFNNESSEESNITATFSPIVFTKSGRRYINE